MVKVVLNDLLGTKKILKDWQSRQFVKELNFAKKTPFEKGIDMTIAPDMEITVGTGSNKKTYELYGSSVILDVSTKKNWKFWYGLQLHDWI